MQYPANLIKSYLLFISWIRLVAVLHLYFNYSPEYFASSSCLVAGKGWVNLIQNHLEEIFFDKMRESIDLNTFE